MCHTPVNPSIYVKEFRQPEKKVELGREFHVFVFECSRANHCTSWARQSALTSGRPDSSHRYVCLGMFERQRNPKSERHEAEWESASPQKGAACSYRTYSLHQKPKQTLRLPESIVVQHPTPRTYPNVMYLLQTT